MSSLSKMDKLTYSIGLIDKVTGPVNKIMAKINQLSEQTASAKEQLTGGLMNAAGGAMMLVGSLNPAIEAQAALGEVQSLDVSNQALTQLNNTAMNFVSNYGGNTAEVIRSSYDIQSAISGLTGKELAQFTESSSILAKGTKSDAATTTDYFGTMYGIYQDTAKEVGKSEWIQMLTGQTAASVRMFKTTGSEMAGAFSTLGAEANSHGITMNESMAVLGQLQATMSGSEAGTKYRAFLGGVGKAQQKLGIQLTDAQGRMLPMVDVMNRLHEKFGIIDTVAESDALQKAFGTKEAVALIKQLMPQVDQLENNINQLSNISDMGVAVEMAEAMGSAWDRFGGSLNAALVSMGQTVLPIIEPIVDLLAKLLQGVVWLTQEFPVLSGIIGAFVVALVGATVIMGTFNALVGLYRLAMLQGAYATQLASIWSKAWSGVLVIQTAAMKAASFAAANYGNALMFAGGVLSRLQTMSVGVLTLVTAKLGAAATAAWGFSAALFANPITWIVVGVVAAIAAVSALVYYFDEISTAFNNWADNSAVWTGMKIAFDLITLPLQIIWYLVKSIGLAIYEFVAPAFSFISELVGTVTNSITSAFIAVYEPIAAVFSGIGEFISSVFDGVLSKVSAFFTFFSDITASVTGFLKTVAENGILKMVIDFFSDDEEAQKISQQPSSAVQSLEGATHANAIQQNLPAYQVAEYVIPQVQSHSLQSLEQAQSNNVVQFASLQTGNSVTNRVLEQTQNGALSSQSTIVFPNNVMALSNAQVSNNTSRTQQIFAASEQTQATNFTNTPISKVSEVNQALSSSVIPLNAQVLANHNIANSNHHAVGAEQTLTQNTQLAYLDHAITNNAQSQIIEQSAQSFEQEQIELNSTYVAKPKRSAFLQQLAKTNNISTSNASSDNSKNVHIDNLTVKTDDMNSTLEDVLELAS
ncbi:phage tail tape measure protein [Pseudoalteromonas obscura]|uniref:Phage tail tape measure protein n=1 Tax=Pseudoalteromonas obscura TaxID=3048491 RepID=A0ABT7EJK3_9GAMM|nr:phage tail tape measure protein [Pseudoalteromonas sp. P94(2023)]MDK2595206.1 phage tail tape measure protein [Pseudoalteromonas sp. P94(2023)]